MDMGVMKTKMRSVADGKFMWNEIAMPNDQKMIQKYSITFFEKMNGGNGQNPMKMVDDLQSRYIFTDAHEEKLGDTDVYVLEGSLSDELLKKQAAVAEEVGGKMAGQMAMTQMAAMKKTRIYVAKNDLMLRKSEVFDDKGEVIMGVTLSNIKLGEKFDEAQFKYTPPEGANVMDMDDVMKKAREAGQ
jgi:outer membrane lipoprotein-sorting protein